LSLSPCPFPKTFADNTNRRNARFGQQALEKWPWWLFGCTPIYGQTLSPKGYHRFLSRNKILALDIGAKTIDPGPEETT